MQSSNPYVGPRPFEWSDAERFFGRDREAHDLLSLVIVNSEVLLYSPSGAGKTSLIYARILPDFAQEDFEVLPPVRVVGHPRSTGNGMAANVYVLNVLLCWAAGEESPGELAGLTLKEYLSRRRSSPRAPEESPLRVAIFDQFEELFTAYPDQWQRRRELIEQICEALEQDPCFRVLFSMREDYIAELDPYQSLFPGRLRTRYRLERLRPPDAVAAIKGPSEQAGRPFDAGVAERLVDDLSTIKIYGPEGMQAVRGEFIEPVQLQVVCHRLWESLAAADVHHVTHEHLASSIDVDEALSNYYEESLRVVVEQAEISEKALRGWFDQVLTTPSGTRGCVLQGESEAGGVPNHVVQRLVDLHLVRAEIRRGDLWYELAHDRLVAPIRTSNQRWLRAHEPVEVRQLEERAEEWGRRGRPRAAFLSQDEFAAEADRWARERQRLRRQAVIAWFIAVLAGAFGVLSWLLR